RSAGLRHERRADGVAGFLAVDHIVRAEGLSPVVSGTLGEKRTRACVHRLSREPRQSSSRGKGLEVRDAAAATDRAVEIDGHVTELPCRRIRAVHELSA